MPLSMVKGPGKFEGELLVTEYVAELETDETVGGDDGGAFADLYLGSLVNPDTIGECDWLMAEDRAFLFAQSGAILETRSDGFVSAEYFETDEALRLAWKGVQEAYSE